MNYIQGRDNLSCTVYVPFDCENNCPFCPSKGEYQSTPSKPLTLLKQLQRIEETAIKEVVFTGGEPMADIDALELLVKTVPSKDVYINTTFLRDNCDEFIKLVNHFDNIKGVNISRHGLNLCADEQLLYGIANDERIPEINVPVRINCVVPHNTLKSHFKIIIARWQPVLHNLDSLVFRLDSRKTSIAQLHDIDDVNLGRLFSLDTAIYKGRTMCNVCNTSMFNVDGLSVRYHRGVPLTAITYGSDTMEINDIILRQDGQFYFDWDVSKPCDIKDIESLVNSFDDVDEDDLPIQLNHRSKHFLELDNSTFTQSCHPSSRGFSCQGLSC